MSNYEDDIEPIAEPSEAGASGSALGKRGRGAADDGDASDRYRMSPEPDEDLDMSKGRHPVWLVKIPKFLLEAWSSISTDDLRLGTVRVYDPDHTGHQRMELLLPEAPQPPIPTEPGSSRNPRWETMPRAYDLKLTSNSEATLKRNIYAFREKVEDVAQPHDDSEDEDGPLDEYGRVMKRSRTKRTTCLNGTVTNEAALQPQIRSTADAKQSFGSSAPISDSYRELLRKRREEASKPKRSIKMLDSSDAGRHNMLVAGVGNGLVSQKSRFNAAIAQKPKSSSSGGAPEKFARMPKNELLDLLFTLFERWQYWSLKKLRSETQQPESYLRETLTGIADLHKRGPYVGNWSLKPEYSNMRKEQEKSEQQQQQQQQQQRQALPSASNGAQNDDEDFGENDDDSDDDDLGAEDFDDV